MSDECLSVETFCEKYVEPMGVESDHVHIVAMQDVFQVRRLCSPSCKGCKPRSIIQLEALNFSCF